MEKDTGKLLIVNNWYTTTRDVTLRHVHFRATKTVTPGQETLLDRHTTRDRDDKCKKKEILSKDKRKRGWGRWKE